MRMCRFLSNMLAKFCFADGKCLINTGFHTFTIVYIGIYIRTHNCSLQLSAWKLKLYYYLKCDLECLSLNFLASWNKVINNFFFTKWILSLVSMVDVIPFLCTYHVFMDALHLISNILITTVQWIWIVCWPYLFLIKIQTMLHIFHCMDWEQITIESICHVVLI